MGGMSDEAIRRMSERAAKIRDGAGFQVLQLSGKKADVEPGGSILLRLLPRWDYIKSFKRTADNKYVEDPSYEGGEIFFEAREHWFDDHGGKRQREWCPAFHREGGCPQCEAADAADRSGTQEDKKRANDLRAKEVFLFNCVVRTDMYDEAGRPKIRVLPANRSIFKAISRLVRSEAEADGFSRGDISKPADGYDIKLLRPPAGSSERWAVDCAPKSSPLVPVADKDKWKGWPSLLVDLPGLTAEGNVKGYAELYKAMYGLDPEVAPEGQPSDTGGEPDWDGGAAEAPAPFGEEDISGSEIGMPAEVPVTPPAPPKRTPPPPPPRTARRR